MSSKSSVHINLNLDPDSRRNSVSEASIHVRPVAYPKHIQLCQCPVCTGYLLKTLYHLLLGTMK